MAATRLTRQRERAMLGGVCAGIAEAYRIDVTLVRIAFILVTLVTSGLGVLFYLAAWLVMPAAGQTSLPARDVARANVDDVVATAKQRASDLRRVHPDDIAEGARRAAQEVTRAAAGVAHSAREALTRDSSAPAAPNTPPSTGASTSAAPVWTPPPSQPRARHAGFKPRSATLPGGNRRTGRDS
jgi:phage shock protein C